MIFYIIVDDEYLCYQDLVVSSSGAGYSKQRTSLGNYTYFGKNTRGKNVYQHRELNGKFLQCDWFLEYWMLIELNLMLILN